MAHRVAVVIPALNESRVIGKVVKAVRRRLEIDAVFLTDDGSTDGTAEVGRKAGARVLVHPRNRGVGAALRTGFEAATKAGFDTIVVMGADDQDNPSEIPRLLGKLDAGYDFVQGSRWLADGRVVDIPLFRRITTIGYSMIFTVLVGRRITDGTNGFRAFRSKVLRGIDLRQSWLDTYELEPYFYWYVIKRGYTVGEAPVTKRYPKVRKGYHYTKMKPFRDWWRILRPLLLLFLRIKR